LSGTAVIGQDHEVPADGDSISLELTAMQWATIDARMDNVVSNAIDSDDEQAVQVGTAIREAGWDQVPWVEGEWPPMEQVITITLSLLHWRFVTTELTEAIPRWKRLGMQESLDLCRSALDELLPQLPT
jgi:hypothetical protein